MPDRSDPDPEIGALRADVETLRGLVTALDAELRRAHQRVDLTMRGQLRCRACSCRRIAHAMQVLDRGDGDARKPMSLYQPSWWSSKTQGKLEAYVCTGCGLVEWWVNDPGALQAHDDYLRIIDGEALGDKAPYR
jgi:hypothetical protein